MPWSSVNTVFSDYDLRGKLKPLGDYITNHVVLTKAARSPPSSWSHSKQQMHHVKFGGVTDGSWWVHVYLAKAPASTESLLIKEQAKRDLSSILDSMVSSGRPCAAPRSIDTPNLPKVTEIRPGTYHGCGLLPWNSQKLWVIAPSVFSPTKWCCRGLTITEKLLSRDISQDQMASLSRSLLLKLGQDSTYVPGKCCLAFLDAIQAIETNPIHLASNHNLNSKVDSPVKWAVLPRCEGDASVSNANQDSDMDLENRWLAEAEQKRMKAATKSDDAEVPMHLWDQRLLPALLQSQRTAILTPIRALVLRWWHRHLLRDFLSWFWGTHKSLNRELFTVDQILKNKEARPDWEAGRECIVCSSNCSWWD